MNLSFSGFMWLIWPVVAGFVLLIFQFFLRQSSGVTKLCISFLGLVGIEHTVRSTFLLRIFLILLAVFCFSLQALRDYTKPFCHRYKMQVFFDDEGLEAALRQFTEKELDELRIEHDWINEKRAYFDGLNRVIQERFGSAFRFDDARGAVHSEGFLDFRVQRLMGWQKYQMVSGNGSLTHEFEMPGHGRQQFSSEFELLKTGACQIQISPSDVFLHWTKIVAIEFKQEAVISATERIYHHNLLCVNKLRFFPIPDVGETIYLISSASGTGRVPIGYCISSPD